MTYMMGKGLALRANDVLILPGLSLSETHLREQERRGKRSEKEASEYAIFIKEFPGSLKGS